MNQWQVSLITMSTAWLLVGLPYSLSLYSKIKPLWAELNALTGDVKVSKKILSRAVRKHWMKGTVYCYEIAIASYKHHHPPVKYRRIPSPPKPGAANYRPTTDYKPRNRPSTTPQAESDDRSTDPRRKRVPVTTNRPPAPKPVPAPLLYKLDGLTKDRATSDRLVDGLAYQFPGKSRTWLVEKAIADLERDRYRH